MLVLSKAFVIIDLYYFFVSLVHFSQKEDIDNPGNFPVRVLRPGAHFRGRRTQNTSSEHNR